MDGPVDTPSGVLPGGHRRDGGHDRHGGSYLEPPPAGGRPQPAGVSTPQVAGRCSNHGRRLPRDGHRDHRARSHLRAGLLVGPPGDGDAQWLTDHSPRR
uniref:Uncharacterized protein n=1 Tax=uncultured marine virus TaxID=186617 RepID=A0A0F7L3R9_9VIRU|nr:hypothetical protein [uncultured marine virus]